MWTKFRRFRKSRGFLFFSAPIATFPPFLNFGPQFFFVIVTVLRCDFDHAKCRGVNISTPFFDFFSRSLYIWIGDVVSIGAHAKSKKKNCSSAISKAILSKFNIIIGDDNV